MTEKEKIYLTREEQQEYLDLKYNLKTSESQGMVKHYKAQLEELIEKGKMRASTKNSEEISKEMVVKRLLMTKKLTVSEIADVVELEEKDILHIKRKINSD